MHRRDVLLAAAATGLLGPARAAAAADALSGEAVRQGPDAVRLTFSSAQGAEILVCADPDGGRSLRPSTRIGRGERSRTFVLAPSPRPYFLLRSGGRVRLRLAERLLPLHGVRNFRDLGGYRTRTDGRFAGAACSARPRWTVSHRTMRPTWPNSASA